MFLASLIADKHCSSVGRSVVLVGWWICGVYPMRRSKGVFFVVAEGHEFLVYWASRMLRAKDPKVRHAQVCKMVAGLVLQGTQVTSTDPWMRDKEVLHACKQLVVIMKDVEESLDDVRDDFEGMRIKTEVAVEATTLGIKPSQA